MADEGDKSQPAPSEERSADPGPVAQDVPLAPALGTAEPVNRAELLNRARAFLTSPQVVYEEPFAKRRFLAEKGLNDVEIETLMREQPPIIPPRTYPQPPPSNIPTLLSGALRILSWIAGGSFAMLLAYFRFVYPLLSQSFQARYSLRSHQKELLSHFILSLESTKATQKDTFGVLPQPQPYKENPQFAICHTTDDISSLVEESHDIPAYSLLRCAIEELGLKSQNATTEAIFQLMESKFPWVQSQEEELNETKLWEVLSSTDLFEHHEADGVSFWTYRPPPTPSTPPLLESIRTLENALPGPRPHQSAFQKTLQTLSDFTGYIASQTYAMPFHYGVSSLTPEEEEIKREIKALKGLVLNRRSFMPPRPHLPPAPEASVGQSIPQS